MSEHAAYNRIEAARAARRFPVILEQLTGNALTLTAVRLVSPHLTEANHAAVLASARHKSKREIEELVARLYPQPDAPAVVRKLPPPASAPREQATLTLESKRDDRADERAATVVHASPPRSEVRPLAPERYKIQFTVNRETHDRLRRVQDLMRHTLPNGDPGAIFERALVRGAAENKVRRVRSTACRTSTDSQFAPHPRCDQARDLAPRWRSLRVQRHARALH